MRDSKFVQDDSTIEISEVWHDGSPDLAMLRIGQSDTAIYAVDLTPETTVKSINAMVAFLGEHAPDRLAEWEEQIYSRLTGFFIVAGTKSVVGDVMEMIAEIHNEPKGDSDAA